MLRYGSIPRAVVTCKTNWVHWESRRTFPRKSEVKILSTKRKFPVYQPSGEDKVPEMYHKAQDKCMKSQIQLVAAQRRSLIIYIHVFC